MRYIKFLSLTFFVFSASAFAAPDSVSYQGRLTDGGGIPLSGNFSLKFTIYDAPVGGVTLWTETQPAVSVTDGLFSVLLGDVTPLDDGVFSSNPTFLGITVDADPELTPRIPFASVAYSHRVSTVDGATGGSISGDVDVTSTSIGNAFAVTQLGLGRGGFFQVSNGANTEAAVQGTHVGAGPGGSFFSDGGGPGISASATGGIAAEFSGDVNTTGDDVVFDGVDTAFHVDASLAQISTFGNDGLEQIRLWGNSWGEIFLHDNTDNDITATLSATSNSGGQLILGDALGSATITLAAGNSGDASAVLPVNSINAGETAEEAGIANRIQGSSVLLSGSADVDILIRTITAPNDGYVIAFATGQISHSHINGGFSAARVAIVPPGGTLFTSPFVEPTISANAPTGTYDIPFAVNAVFAVNSGSNQFRLQADETGSGSPTVEKSQLTLLYVPTAYGFVTSNLNPAPPTGQDTPDQELAATKRFDDQRIQQELADMRAKLDAFEASLKESQAQRP